MSLLTLPPELLAIIIRELDTTSIHNLHEVGVYLGGLVSECHFSMNTLATARSLRSNFFLEISHYLKVLNLSGVPDLDSPSLTHALANMSNLTDLDVTYTDIILPDLLQIVKVRPSLKSIGINYTFGGKDIDTIRDDLLMEYQIAFGAFRNVTLVCNQEEDFQCKQLTYMLLKADLDTFKLIFPRCISLKNNERYDCISFKRYKDGLFECITFSDVNSN